MILSPTERKEALDSILKVLTDPDFELSHISVDACSREVPSDKEGMRKFEDSGVHVVLIIGTMPLKPDEYGAETSTDAESYEWELAGD
jgi:hypothetical protein